ncbi:MAG: prepilin-type N-terminal cleavage/methylation domain-containing protein [Paraburkholderia tropica]|nr:prepilin-type N-terminal cleavage/methylation domain-containing protein [Paraburkholderia tropica]
MQAKSKKKIDLHWFVASGFTLTELLIVLAIIGVLSAIVLTSTRSMMEKARQSQCAANLRQINVAALAWSAENNGKIVPVFDPGDDNGANKLGLPHWTGLLAPYMGRSSNGGNFTSIREMPGYICPAKSDTFGYGYNYRYLSYRQAGLQNNGWWATYAGTDTPSKVVMITDVWKPQDTQNWRPFVRVPDGGTDMVVHFRHPGSTANVLWVDGHVSSEKSDSALMTDLSLWGKK